VWDADKEEVVVDGEDEEGEGDAEYRRGTVQALRSKR
jgi:hypothetical protein